MRDNENKRIEDYCDGLSSDDEELDADVLRFNAEYDKCRSDASLLFEDVHEDFTDLPVIMARFEQWKLAFSSTYSEAYINIYKTI